MTTSHNSEPNHPRHRLRASCRLCNGASLAKVIELAPTPPANAFVPKDKLALEQRRFPLDVYFCETCGHVQLLDIIDPTDLFTDYVYVSGTSPANVDHFRRYAEQVIERCKLEANDLVVEIGSNDGTMLRFFQEAGMRVLGVDPAQNIAAQASAQGIETLADFFTPALAQTIRDTHGPAAVVCANNVCAHVDDLQGVVHGARTLIEPSGTFVFQVSYLLDVFDDTLFDTMYHEHLDYHRVGPLTRFFAEQDMCLWDTARVEAQGGSLRGYVSHIARGETVRDSVREMKSAEESKGLDSPDTLRGLASRITRAKVELSSLLRGLQAQNRTIAAYGAPAKATTLMHQFGLDGDTISYIVEDNPLKHGLFTPGLHVPVLPMETLYERMPDYVVVLAWNFADSIIERHRAFSKTGGRFVVPLPNLRVC